MEVKKLTMPQIAYPSVLREIAGPPKELFYIGADPAEWLGRPRVAMVGTRHVSPYGQQITAQFARELTEQGVVIISGLALGVDGIAHGACLDAGGTTVAVLFALGMAPAAGRAAGRRGDTAEEQAVLDLLYGGITDGHELLLQTSLPAVQFNQALTMLEISGKVRALGNNHWTAA
jgi:predicted Rossmann fold nucleotide-binding protein DprA/Smf involved in DNA uptake